MKRFTADFETATWYKDETYVWAWATCEIGNEDNITINNNISTFIDYLKENKNSIWYFHNLRFDGGFIIDWLEKNGFKHVIDKNNIEDNTYTTLISELNVYYNITIYFKKGNKTVEKATIYDSYKIIPFKIDEIPKYYNLGLEKLDIDYKKYRSKNHILSKQEKDYIKNDVIIAAKALKTVFDEKLTRMTRAGNALYDYKNMIGNNFTMYFPTLSKDLDKELRKSYRRWIYLCITGL